MGRKRGAKWAIRCINNHRLFWSNKDGWVETMFDLFTDREKATLNLPIEGEWYWH